MKLQGVIFDLDGTLGNTLPVVFEAFRRVLGRSLGRHFSDDEIRALFGPTEEGILQQLVPDQWEACLETYLAAYDEIHAQYAQPFPGIEDALQLLKQCGVPLAIVTAKGRHSAAISLRHLGLAHYFDAVETGTAEGAVKPMFIRKVLARWGAPSGQVAYVGDATYDMEAAREAGVIPLGAAWAATADADRLESLSPQATFRSVESFIQWIEVNVDPKGQGNQVFSGEPGFSCSNGRPGGKG
jgi:pyrophosphatase PpaX